MLDLRGDAAVGPTALYTGHVWARNGLSNPALSTLTGRAIWASLQPAMLASALVGGPTFEAMLLERHEVIDDGLEAAIAAGEVGSIVEIACGMSPRGWRLHARHGDALTYVEADLPAMAGRKRRALTAAGSLDEHHRVVALDARARTGPASLRAVLGGLDAGRGVVVVTEGLLNYLSEAAVRDLWARIAREARRFPHVRYLADVGLGAGGDPLARLATAGLSAVVRNRVGLHFAGAAGARAALLEAGFAHATVHPLAVRQVAVLDASGA